MAVINKERRQRLREKFDLEIQKLQSEELQLIVMKVGDQKYGFDILRTKEIVATPSISKLPHSQEYVLGVAHFRASMMLMMDPKAKFLLTEPVIGTFTLILEHAAYKIGLVTDDIPFTINILGNQLKTTSGILRDATREETFIKAVVENDGDSIYIIDIEEFIEDNKIDLQGAKVQ